MMTARNSLSRVMLPVVALASGIIVALILVATRPEAQKVEQQEQGVLVQSIRVQRGDAEVTLRARGTVTAAQEVVLHPEVGGRVTWLHDRLVPGGRIAKGKVLVRIDARDYQLALQAGQAQLEQARVELELERGRQVIAQREWEAFGGADAGVDDPSRQRALRQPQMQAAEVSLQAAQSNLQQRALSLQRTRITAPFNALVLSERVDKGQLVTPQNEIARLVGTDAYWVRVSIPVGALSAIDVPGLRGVDEGSAAQIVQQLGNEHVRRQGRVRRLLADLDPGGTMARITVEVRDPLGLQDEGEPKLPLLLSSYVEVILEARPLKNVVTLPRTALREGDKAYVIDSKQRLDVRQVQVVWSDDKRVYIRQGLRGGEQVIVSPIATPVRGMQLRVQDDENRAASKARKHTRKRRSKSEVRRKRHATQGQP